MSAAIYVPATWASGPCLGAFSQKVASWRSFGAYTFPCGARGSYAIGLFYGRPRACAVAPGPN